MAAPRPSLARLSSVRQRGLYSDITSNVADATSGPAAAFGGTHESAAQLISAAAFKGPSAPIRAPSATEEGGAGSVTVDQFLAQRKLAQRARAVGYQFTIAASPDSNAPDGVAAASFVDGSAGKSASGAVVTAVTAATPAPSHAPQPASPARPPVRYPMVPFPDAHMGSIVTSGPHAGAPLVAVEPKVFVQKARTTGAPPRLVEIERKKRQFVALHAALPQSLAANGICFDVPGGEAGTAPPTQATSSAANATASSTSLVSASASTTSPRAGRADAATKEGAASGSSLGLTSRAIAALPLAAFDDSEHEIREPSDWLTLGILPAPAPVPVPSSSSSGSDAVLSPSHVRLDGRASRGQHGVPGQALFITAHKPALNVTAAGTGNEGGVGGPRRSSSMSRAAASDKNAPSAYSLTSGTYTGVWRQCRVMAYDQRSQLYTVLWVEEEPAAPALRAGEHGPAGSPTEGPGAGHAGRARSTLQQHITAGRTMDASASANGDGAPRSSSPRRPSMSPPPILALPQSGSRAGGDSASVGSMEPDAASGTAAAAVQSTGPSASPVGAAATDGTDGTPMAGEEGTGTGEDVTPIAKSARSQWLVRAHGVASNAVQSKPRGHGPLHRSDDGSGGGDGGSMQDEGSMDGAGNEREGEDAFGDETPSLGGGGGAVGDGRGHMGLDGPSALAHGSSFFNASQSLGSIEAEGAHAHPHAGIDAHAHALALGHALHEGIAFPRATWTPADAGLASTADRFAGPCPVPVPPGVPYREVAALAGTPTPGGTRQPAYGWALVPRIHLCFAAENPETFTKRIVAAVSARRAAAAILRFHLIADCTPQDLDLSVPSASVERIARRLIYSKQLRSYLYGGTSHGHGHSVPAAQAGAGGAAAAAAAQAGVAATGSMHAPSWGGLAPAVSITNASPTAVGATGTGGARTGHGAMHRAASALFPAHAPSIGAGPQPAAPTGGLAPSSGSIVQASPSLHQPPSALLAPGVLPEPLARLLAEAASDYRRTMNVALLARALKDARSVLASPEALVEGSSSGSTAAARPTSGLGVGDGFGADGASASGEPEMHATPGIGALVPSDHILPSKVPPYGRSVLGGLPTDVGILTIAHELGEGVDPATGKPALAALGPPSLLSRFLALPNAGAPGTSRSVLADSSSMAPGTVTAAINGRVRTPAYDFRSASESYAFQTLYSQDGSVVAVVRLLNENQKLWRAITGLPFVSAPAADILAPWNVTGPPSSSAKAPSPASIAASISAWVAGLKEDFASGSKGRYGAKGAANAFASVAHANAAGATGGGGAQTTAAAGHAQGGANAQPASGGASAASLMASGTLYSTLLGKSSRIDEFEHSQQASITAFASYLRDGWAQSIRNHVRQCFANSGKGNFNLKETDSKAYEFSKLRRFLRMLNYRMTDQLRYVTDVSLKDYVVYILFCCSLRVDVAGTNVVNLSLPEKAKLTPQQLQDEEEHGKDPAAVAALRCLSTMYRPEEGEKPLATIVSGVFQSAGTSGGVVLGGKRRVPLFSVDLVTKDLAAPTPAPTAGTTGGAAGASGGAAGAKPGVSPRMPAGKGGPGGAAGGKAGAGGGKSKDDEDDGPHGKSIGEYTIGDLEAMAIAGAELPADLVSPIPVTSAPGPRRVFAYSVPVSNIVSCPITVFDRGLKALSGVLQVERQVMDKLFWPSDPTISVVHPGEPHVVALRQETTSALERACEPLSTYLSTYQPYIQFLNLDVDTFSTLVKAKFAAGGFNLNDVRTGITRHREAAAAVLEEVPAIVNLGLVQVNVNDIRTALSRKHRDCADALLKLMVAQANEFSGEATKAYDGMIKQLNMQASDIEGVTQLREYMASCPDKIKEQKGKLDAASAVYSALDAFGYAMPREQFDIQWKAEGGAARVFRRMQEVEASLDSQKGRFLDEMASDQAEFEEHLNALAADVAALGAYLSLDQVATVSPIVTKLRYQINAADEKAKLFNTREALFGRSETNYEKLVDIKKAFEPFQSLWETAANWVQWQKTWMTGPFNTLNAEAIEKEISNASRTMARCVKSFERLGIEGCLKVARQVRDEIDTFRPNIPLVTALRNPGMRERHWNELSEATGHRMDPEKEPAKFTLAYVLSLNLSSHIDVITKIGEKAGKEYQIEMSLAKMKRDWENISLDIVPHKETGTYLLRGVDVLQALLDEHVTMTQAMTFSAFKKPFAEEIDRWADQLNTVSDVIEEWMKVQRSWMYLEPIFSSPDIQKQLPTEYKRFSTVDKNWRTTLLAAKGGTAANAVSAKAITFCANEKLLERFTESNKFLDLVQKSLSDFLDSKRKGFPRFYFLSNDELLQILSQTKDPRAVQPHLKKCFEGVRSVVFNEAGEITTMVSGEGEMVPLVNKVDPRGKNVENWMSEFEASTLASVKSVMFDAVVDYTSRPRTEWTQHWPGQCVLNASQLHWTREIEEGIRTSGAAGVHACYEQQLSQLRDMVILIRQKLPPLAKMTLGSLTVIDVHARDVTKHMADVKVSTLNDFDWISNLRYYWAGEGKAGEMNVQMVSSIRPYGNEYLGNSLRLVITPLTDKCYLTLMGALQVQLGGAPAGPAGTGKTETTKDLAKALAKYCVVFNCSDGLDYRAMAKFFKGLACCGAWACFDEFNRIDVEVLSVVAQQLLTLQDAVKSGVPSIMFEGSEITVNSQYAAFITMNPGYAGRTELPDNLKALFRPVAMMVPDYALIGEISLFSFGFEKAQECARKMVATFKLCSEQLSSQDHYDYGMRAVKTVITAAGNLKAAHPDEPELQLLFRSLQDVNAPKFLSFDLPLFRGIMSDLFPGISKPNVDYGDLSTTLAQCAEAAKLQPVPHFITKCVQVYETVVVRHGMMVVGPTGGGKSSMLRTTQSALTALHAAGKEGPKIQKVFTHTVNPKSITMDQLYGGFDPNTHEWTDGILARIVRDCASATGKELQWVIFDGPVDAIWIENMNTVLDDNKKLCLVSGEIISLTNEMTIMFEVEDLAVASPATVSRCGMVYTEPQSLGIDVLLQSWVEALPPSVFSPAMLTSLNTLFSTYLKQSLYFLRRHLSEPVPTVDNQLVRGLLNILHCFFEPYLPKEARDAPSAEAIKHLAASLPSIFIFALIWTVGATTTADGRKRFNAFVRGEMESHGFGSTFTGPANQVPPAGMLYDQCFDLAGNLGPSGEALVASGASLAPRWMPWMATIPPYEVPGKGTDFSELIVPTKDSVRYKFLAKALLCNRHPFLMAGATGTGKTVSMTELLAADMPKEFVPISLTFSAQTSANQTQDLIDGKMDRRARGTFGPTAGTVYVLFVDDLNMPQKEKYGAQPPIELLRQFADYGGWYDRKERTFRRIVDTVMLAAMGPPGGGRNPITARMTRQFNVVTATPLDDESLHIIFDSILNSFVSNGFADDVKTIAPAIVTSTIAVYSTIVDQLLPTPSKPHYTFNLRDLGKVFQGMLMGDYRRIPSSVEFARLWVHECRRVFADRLVNNEDKAWFDAQLRSNVESEMKLGWEVVVPPAGVRPRLIFGDYADPRADVKVYAEIENVAGLQPTIEEYLSDYNAESKAPMKLVMFLDAIEHVSKLCRILRQPQGNALLLGVGGSGRQSLTRLAAAMADYELFTIEITKGYGKTEWRESLKQVLMKAGIEEKPIVFLFNDTQIVFEGQLEDINNVLNSGDVPNLYAAEDMDAIMTACRQECLRRKIAPTKINIFSQYLLRVRRNIHVVLCMSPMGDAFRNRVRMFPALVNCCTINWFSEWPEEALRSVAMSTLTEENLQLDDHLPSVVEFFTSVHTSVAQASSRYAASLRRYNYVTPTSYLELLSTFRTVLQSKREEVGTLRSRLQTGLDKISSTEQIVSKLQDELVAMRPKLEATQIEVAEMIVQLTKDKASAAETKTLVEKEEAKAQMEAAATKAIADDAQADLDKALPALDAAADCLASLERKHFDEIRSLRNPPQLVKTCIEAACIMFGIKPVVVKDQATGEKVDDYWSGAASGILANSNKLLADLKDFDKDKIPESIITKVSPYIENPLFVPETVGKASQACKGICLWVRAMHTYYFVAKDVEPKKLKLKEAQEKLDLTMEQLASVKARLAAVMKNIQELEEKFEEANTRKENLAREVELCKARLERAHKLIGGLGGEKDRWTAQVAKLTVDYTNIVGDALVSSSTIAYLGAFTADFRRELVEGMHKDLARLRLPHTTGCSVMTTLADPVQVRAWNLAGLPTDSLSVENGIIMARARRWPLLIDPQGQANRFVRNMGKDKAMALNGIDVLRQSDKRFLQTLEQCIRFGKWCLIENVGETLDAALEPVLLKLVTKSPSGDVIRLGDTPVPYSSDFKLFLTSTLPNPHYAPEVQVKVSLLNFTITPQGLEDQLLGTFVVNELPELEDRKNALMLANARNRKELADIENRILYLLSNSTGNILDDEELIETLSNSKVKSNDISAQVKEAEKTEKEIDATREKYRPVAYRASILYFCVTDLSSVDPMYQFSLGFFSNLFVAAIRNSTPSDDIATRIENLNSYFTSSVYRNVCRSLFEQHKLLFSMLMAVKILQGDNKIDPTEWRFLIAGQAPDAGAQAPLANPDPTWITEKMWTEVVTLSKLPAFAGLAAQCTTDPGTRGGLRAIFDSNDSHKVPLPGAWNTKLNSLQRMCLLRCIRPDKLMLAVQDFVIESLGRSFVEPPPFDIGACFADSTVTTPLIFVLSAGSDPTKAFYQFAESAGMRSKVESISLGQGQGGIAAQLISNAQLRGQWVLLQNCHLASSWMGDLERIVESIEADKVSKDFRMWLTSMPSKTFPVSVLQNGVKMTNEPPKGLRANLKQFYYQMNDDSLSQTEKPAAFRKLLFGLAFFHAVVQERKRFGPLGWNRPYDFNNSDLEISMRQLMLFLDEYEEIPYRVLHTLTSYINYGGRVTDDKDARTIDVILRDYFTPSVLLEDYTFTPSGLYFSPTVDEEGPHKGYMEYIDGLPLNAAPEVFGMHPNANITCDTNETEETLDIIVSLQPRTGAGSGKSREAVIADTARDIAARLPDDFDIEAISMRYPVLYEESMNTVLVQECIRYNKLLAEMKKSLVDIQKALKGLVVMSKELDEMGTGLHANKVPGRWEEKAYPSLKPLSAWVVDLLERLKFIGDWVAHGAPPVFIISNFFFPQAFLTGTMQNYARKKALPIDTLAFDFQYLNRRLPETIAEKPEDGCYIRGLYLEGARYDEDVGLLADSIPKQLFTQLPVMHLIPVQNRVAPTTGIYRCPVYKILSRWGVLATTGHSSNFIMFIEVPTDKPTITNNVGEADCGYWIKAGVAAFTSLKF